MGPLTRSGRQASRLLPLLLTLTICAAYAQTLTLPGRCLLTSLPIPVRAEGLTEPLGNLILNCSGSTPGAVVSGTLTVSLPVSITNRVGPNNATTDVVVSADLGTGYTPLPVTGQVNGNSIILNGINFAVPASGNFSLQIANLRANASALGATPAVAQPIPAQVTFPVPLSQTRVLAAMAEPGLLATLYDQGRITCTGSPLPASLTVSNLFAAGTNFASARLTEGFPAAFMPKRPGEDNGTRLLIQYAGFPAGTQLYLPDLVAGSDAAVPSSGGDMGLPQATGQYVPGSHTLLLARVLGADANGAGGYVTAAPTGAGPATLDSVSPVSLAGGSGYAVYEVIDANPDLLESAQVPTFVGLATVTAPASATEAVSFAPISNVATASSTAPIPRFVPSTPASDCNVVGDCGAGYFPHLVINATGPVQLTGISGGRETDAGGYVGVHNEGGGTMQFTATAQYITGNGWLSIEVDPGAVRFWGDPKNLAPGTYQANIVFDAGPIAGSVTLPVVFTVSPAPAGAGTTGTTGSTNPPNAPATAVTISAVVNAATFQPTPLVAGSLGTVRGANLAGKSVAATFDGAAADILYSSATQINLRVPPALAGKSSASLVVTVDGNSSAPQTVVLASAWPAIFSGGILNPDYSVNGASSGAPAGSFVSIWATGIPDGATVSINLGDRSNLVPLYAGPAPDVLGVQQVNVAIPADMPAGTVPISICASTGSTAACSPASAVTVTH